MGFIVDTNVAMVASRLAPQADERCVGACIGRLAALKGEGGLLVDDLGLILREYSRNLGHSGQPGAGHAFAKWAHDHQAIPAMVRRVPINAIRGGGNRGFQEFPEVPGLSGFDRSDQKFVAVALASGENPPILNAVDSDWWDYRDALAGAGVNVEFLCPRHSAG